MTIIKENKLIPYYSTAHPEGPYLIFAPHPDDETLGMGGTIALAAKEGIAIYVVFMTNGDMGGDPNIRIEETNHATAVLTVKKNFYLNLKDRHVDTEKLPEKILIEIINTTQPKTFFLPSFQEIHPDHRATTRKILNFLQKRNFSFTVWFYEINRQGEINCLIDISSVINVKKQAIDCYKSQQEILDYKTHCLSLNYARSITLGGKSVYTEGFWVYDSSSGKDAEQLYFNHIVKYFSKKLQKFNGIEKIKKELRFLKGSSKNHSTVLSRYLDLLNTLAKVINTKTAFINKLQTNNHDINNKVNLLQDNLSKIYSSKAHRLALFYIKFITNSKLRQIISFKYSRHKISNSQFTIKGNSVENINNSNKPSHLFKDTLKKILIDANQHPIVCLQSLYEVNDGLQKFDIDEKNTHITKTVVNVYINRPVAFVLHIDRNDLANIKLLMGTYERVNSGILCLELYADEQLPNEKSAGEKDRKPFRSSKIMAPSIMDNTFVSFSFDPIANSKNRTFFAVLKLHHGELEKPVALWTYPLLHKKTVSLYQTWIKKYEIKDKVSEQQPFIITVLLPVFDLPDGNMLEESVNSVLSQISCKVQLIFIDYTIKNSKQLQKWGELSQVSILKCDMYENITYHLNQAVEMLSTDFFLCLKPYDTLAENAFLEVAQMLKLYPETDVFYSDEDKIDNKGVRIDPFCKPDWSLDLFLSLPSYPGALTLFKKQLVQQVGGFAKGFEACAEYELMLRISEATDKITHIPKVLYHRRVITEQNQNFDILWNNGNLELAEKALETALIGRGEKCQIQNGLTKNSFKVSYCFNTSILVSIIIPFKDYPELLETAINSILQITSYTNYEIICVNNQSVQPRTFALIDKLKSISGVTVIHDDGPFNYSAINNRAVSHAKGDMLLFLNSDTEVISENWLESMLEHACRKEVGAVGAKLYFVNDTIQHAGIVLGVAGVAGHAFRHVHMNDTAYYHGLSSVIRNVSGVTGACMMIRRDLFEQMDGFDEEKFQVSYNDLDLCLRLRQNGYTIIYTPFAQLYHYESYSRGYSYDKFATLKIREKWGNLCDVDPFYNPNLTTVKEDWSLRE